jgi:Na+-transporting NADH:ubiquinone oxidoreductase subunit F
VQTGSDNSTRILHINGYPALARHRACVAGRPFGALLLLCLTVAVLCPPRAVAAGFQAAVIQVEDLNHNVKRIRLRALDAGFSFKPGQFVLLRLPASYLNEFNRKYGTTHKAVSRAYSFASAPSEAPFFDLIIKHYPAPPGKDVPPGLASTYVHTQLKQGDTLLFSEPLGSLYAPGASTDPIIVVAGGSGASPFIGLVKHWLEQKLNERRKIYFFFGVTSKKDFFLEEELQAWARQKNFVYIPAVSRPEPGDNWQGATGYINVVLDRHFTAPLQADVYMAGAPILVSETIKVLTAKGVPAERIHHDPVKVE